MEEQQQRRTAWERQLLIRDKNRPTVRDYIPRIFTDFYEMHGDRNFGDDGAIIGGIGRLDGIPVTVLAQVKGRNLRENKASNFAMPHPEGYRKAKLQARFSSSVLPLRWPMTVTGWPWNSATPPRMAASSLH